MYPGTFWAGEMHMIIMFLNVSLNTIFSTDIYEQEFVFRVYSIILDLPS